MYASDPSVSLKPNTLMRGKVGPVMFEKKSGSSLTDSDLSSYQAAADFLNFSKADLVCLQREYGIFGGEGRQPCRAAAAEPQDAGG
jgi:hypothetical protein